MTSQAMGRAIGSLLLIGLTGLGLSGCDYWPPALQAQIEQMQVDAQIAIAERAKLQGQLTETMKMKEELQVRVDDLTRSNRELSGRVSTLEQALASEREKISRMAKSAHKPAPAKAVAKTDHKTTAKKKSTKPTPKRRN
jgi:DNA repair exonuclease SbcCD ATPase subunit